MGPVRPGRGGLEHQVRQFGPGQQPVHAFRAGLDAASAGPLQTLGRRVHAHHVPDLDVLAALQLGQQVGADVARPDNRRDAHCASLVAKRAVTRPRPANVAVSVSPGPTGTEAVTEPGRITCPASSSTPRAPTVLASQARAFSGEPSTAPLAPVPASSPFWYRLHPASRRSTADRVAGLLPSTTPPEEALSAMVSASPIFQSLIRESISSSAGSTKPTAATASAIVTPGPRSGLASTIAVSGSTRGCRNPDSGIGSA